MPQEPDRPRPRLARAIAATLALKLAALTVLYVAFFRPPADPAPPRAAAILGLGR